MWGAVRLSPSVPPGTAHYPGEPNQGAGGPSRQRLFPLQTAFQPRLRTSFGFSTTAVPAVSQTLGRGDTR